MIQELIVNQYSFTDYSKIHVLVLEISLLEACLFRNFDISALTRAILRVKTF